MGRAVGVFEPKRFDMHVVLVKCNSNPYILFLRGGVAMSIGVCAMGVRHVCPNGHM